MLKMVVTARKRREQLVLVSREYQFSWHMIELAHPLVEVDGAGVAAALEGLVAALPKPLDVLQRHPLPPLPLGPCAELQMHFEIYQRCSWSLCNGARSNWG